MLAQIKCVARKILHMDDTPHRIAWGVAIGTFISWTPTVGVQMIIAAVAAFLLRGNKAAAVALVWVSNPYTVVPIYWVNHRIGAFVLSSSPIDKRWFANLLETGPQLSWWEYLHFVYSKLAEIAPPLWLGSVMLGLPLAAIAYYATYQAVVRHRSRKAARLELDVSRSSADG